MVNDEVLLMMVVGHLLDNVDVYEDDQQDYVV
jgi:hypothetical protein